MGRDWQAHGGVMDGLSAGLEENDEKDRTEGECIRPVIREEDEGKV
jgi:hypothetical protein